MGPGGDADPIPDSVLASKPFLLLLRDGYGEKVRCRAKKNGLVLTMIRVLALPVDTGNSISNAIPI